MNRLQRMLSLILAAAMILTMAGVMAGCDTAKPAESTVETTEGNVSKGTYQVSVMSVGGMPLEGLDVYIYADNTLADLVDYKKTDAKGTVSFQIAKKEDYAIVLSGAPRGYTVEPYYTFSGGAAKITLNTAVIRDDSLSNVTLGLGDVMYDFTVTTAQGQTVTLSEVLEEKKVAVLNFWYTTCSWCITEFPIMEEAYQQYKDDAAIIALDPLDDASVIGPFQEEMSLTFDMAACPAAWANTFGITGYPTTVVVDRYGVICLIEPGAITSSRPMLSLFAHFTADDYTQVLCRNGIADLVTTEKPTYTMPSSDEIGAAINSGDITVSFRAEEGESADVTWPFILAEKNGETCIKASNQGVDDSFAILYADVTLKAGQAVQFDYLTSCEQSADVLVVIVDKEDIYQISGVSETEEWKACCPWVALEDGTYELALCYLKDGSESAGDDTVYIRDLQVTDAADIAVTSYIPRLAARSEDGFDYTYAEIVYNETDGYYHVGSAEGPLLLVDMMNYTAFNEEQTLWDLAYDGPAKALYEEMERYFTLASNSALTGVCPVTYELGQLLRAVDQAAGFDDADENEWLRLCKYFEVYGAEAGTQLQNPIAGLDTFSAYDAQLGKGVETNFFYYDRIIMPRGYLAKFVPAKSGVYRITSVSDSIQGVDGWIFDENRQELLTYEQDERLFTDSSEVSMVYYMDAGTAYYLDIAFWDPYEIGYIYYDIEYVAPTLEHFRLASPGYFTYDTNATGDAMYHLIAGGIKPVLGADGRYYEDLGGDESGNQKYGSLLYADFTGVTSLFDTPIMSVPAYDENGAPVLDSEGNPVMVPGMIEKGGFDFSKTEDDLYILSFLNKHNCDVSATDAYLKEMWGEEYEAYAELYQIKDVFAGRYHGEGEDLTEEMQSYLSQVISGSGANSGCVVVDQRLAEILQLLMDKYTFQNVDHSWIKLCYYYDHLGPEA